MSTPTLTAELTELLDMLEANDVAGICSRFECSAEDASDLLDNAITNHLARAGLTFEAAHTMFCLARLAAF